jgi:cation diffusion facilitator family transporter
VSVISEAIHSGVDLVAAIIALFAVRTADKPADEEHPFGHGKIENISGTIEAILIFFAGIWIIYEAAKRLIHSETLDAPMWGIVVMLFSTAANLIVSKMLFKVGKETDSVALQADGWHLRTDVWTSAGVMAGLGLILIGRKIFPHTNLSWIDPVAAICVALLIIKAAWQLTVESGKDLLDASLTGEEAEWIRDHIAGQSSQVRGFRRVSFTG